MLKFPKARAYIINIPSYLNKEEVGRIFASIEEIKEGIFDFEHLEMSIDVRHIWVYYQLIPENLGENYAFWKIQNDQLIAI